MSTLYFECAMGAAGDMLMAALYELCPRKAEFLELLNAAGIPGVEVSAAPKRSAGILGTKITVRVHGEEEGLHSGHSHGHTHGHRSLPEIGGLLSSLRVSDRVKRDARAVYGLIAEAESLVHGETAEHVHFHEVGSLDAVADIVGTAMLIEMLGPDSISASPVHVGSGTVRSAHGVLPVPAPATARILMGVPAYGGDVAGELCTPTGAALLKYFCGGFGPMPAMAVSAVGYGMGTKEFGRPNCVRAFLGEAGENGGDVAELACNIDDMTPEALALATELLLEAGALDVWTIPVVMKKGRAAHLLTCLCERGKARRFAGLMLRHTSTIGVRESLCRRHVMERSTETIQTKYGPIRVKTARGFGVTKRKPEFDDVARAVRQEGASALEVRAGIERELGSRDAD